MIEKIKKLNTNFITLLTLISKLIAHEILLETYIIVCNIYKIWQP